MCYIPFYEARGKGREIKMALIIKSNIRKVVKELDKEGKVPNVADEVGLALERVVEETLRKAIERAKANQRRTLQARDL